MDNHEIEIAVDDGDASWCGCTCGWVSAKASVKESSKEWAAHVVKHVYITVRTPSF